MVLCINIHFDHVCFKKSNIPIKSDFYQDKNLTLKINFIYLMLCIVI